jgi:hypothetical protein
MVFQHLRVMQMRGKSIKDSRYSLRNFFGGALGGGTEALQPNHRTGVRYQKGEIATK